MASWLAEHNTIYVTHLGQQQQQQTKKQPPPPPPPNLEKSWNGRVETDGIFVNAFSIHKTVFQFLTTKIKTDLAPECRQPML